MSDVAGYLAPASAPTPLEDDALDDFLGDVIAGITGLNRDTLVRPRWQEDPPNIPDRSVTWCGVGVTNHDPDTYAFVGLESDGLSQNLLRHETLTIIASFYGPESGSVAAMFRDGLQVDQNLEALMTAGFGLISAEGPTAAPELIKEKWYQRSDITWLTRREIRRVYPVLSLLSAHGTIVTTLGTVAFDTSDQV
jgi:hypothetical protein